MDTLHAIFHQTLEMAPFGRVNEATGVLGWVRFATEVPVNATRFYSLYI